MDPQKKIDDFIDSLKRVYGKVFFNESIKDSKKIE
jgi:hypothetical protein